MADFEKLELDTDSTCDSRFALSDYAQVIFANVSETYPAGAHIQCNYTITALLSPSTRDWVGIYKVGWRTSKEYVHFEWVNLPSGYAADQDRDVEGTIFFQGHSLPKDDGEFYQFCYVTSAGHVRGASTPFQFRQQDLEEFVAVEEDDGDLMVIKSRTVVLEEHLNEAVKDKEALTKSREMLEKERDGLLGALVELERKLSNEKQAKQDTKLQLQDCQEKLEGHKQEMAEMQTLHDSLREKTATLNQEKEEILKRLEQNDEYISSLQDKIKALVNEKDALAGRNKSLEEEKELFKTEFASSETQVKAYMGEIDSLKQQVYDEEEKSRKLKEQIHALKDDLKLEGKKLETQASATGKDKAELEDLAERLRNAEDKLGASEHCKTMLNKEYLVLQQAYEKMSEDLANSKSETHAFKSQLQRAEKEFMDAGAELEDKVKQLEEVIEERKEELSKATDENGALQLQLEDARSQQDSHQEAPLFFLQQAQQQLKDRCAKMKTQNRTLKTQMDELLLTKRRSNERESELQKEIVDLKTRLNMGQEEYKERFIECRRLQSELKKVQRRASRASTSSPEKVTTVTEQTQGGSTDTNDEEAVIMKPSFSAASLDPASSSSVADGPSTTTSTTKEPERQESSQEPPVSLANLTNAELQEQLDNLGHELETRQAKKQRYKQLYSEEKERNQFLQKHYFHELKKREDEVEQLKRERDSAAESYAQCLRVMQNEVDETEEKMMQMEQKRNKAAAGDDSQVAVSGPPKTTATGLVPELIYRNPYASYKPTAPPSGGPPLVPPRPDLPQPLVPERQQDSPSRAVSNQATAGSSTADDDDNKPRLYTDSAPDMAQYDPLLAKEEHAERLATPLTPLPPPINPVKLPTAKLAAVLAVNEAVSLPSDSFVPVEPSPVELAAVQAPPSPDSVGRADHVIIQGLEDSFDGDDDRFMDAPGEPQKMCPICNMAFSMDTPEQVISQHVDTHIGPECPICGYQFDVNCPKERLQEHVQGHFSD